jgi:osmotically-inducible protein OsmY
MDEPQHLMAESAARPAARPPESAELAESKLRRSGYLAMRHLSCAFRAGVLTLSGRLPSYYLKQVALAVVATVEGVERIDDQVEVANYTAASASRQLRPAWRP